MHRWPAGQFSFLSRKLSLHATTPSACSRTPEFPYSPPIPPELSTSPRVCWNHSNWSLLTCLPKIPFLATTVKDTCPQLVPLHVLGQLQHPAAWSWMVCYALPKGLWVSPTVTTSQVLSPASPRPLQGNMIEALATHAWHCFHGASQEAALAWAVSLRAAPPYQTSLLWLLPCWVSHGFPLSSPRACTWSIFGLSSWLTDFACPSIWPVISVEWTLAKDLLPGPALIKQNSALWAVV